MAFSKGNLHHPSKEFVDFMINEHTSPELIKRIKKEGYTADDMLKYLFHLKDNGWIKEFQRVSCIVSYHETMLFSSLR